MRNAQRWLAAIVIASMTIGAAPSVFGAEADFGSVTVDGRSVKDSTPIVRDGEVYVPLRAVLEEMGWTVTWYQEGQTVTAQKEGVPAGFLKTSIGYNQAMFNNGMYPTVPPIMVDERTYIAVSALKQLSLQTSWSDATHQLLVESPKTQRGFQYADGRRYEGDMGNGLPNGVGRISDQNGKLLYEGHMTNGLIDGQGRLVQDGRTSFSGTFANEQKKEGLEYRQDGSPAYEGSFENGVQLASGRHYGVDGTKWTADPGNPENGTFQVYPDGVVFRGTFKDGAAEGEGMLRTADGTVLAQGVFVKGSLQQDGVTVQVMKERYYTLTARPSGSNDYTSAALHMKFPFPKPWQGKPIQVTEGPNKLIFSYVPQSGQQVAFLTVKVYEEAQYNKQNGLPDGALPFKQDGGLEYGFIDTPKTNPFAGKAGAENDAAAYAELLSGIDNALKFSEIVPPGISITEDLFKQPEAAIYKRFVELEQWTLKEAVAEPEYFIFGNLEKERTIARLGQLYSPDMAEALFLRQNRDRENGWMTVPTDYISIANIGSDLKVKLDNRDETWVVTISGADVEVAYTVDQATYKVKDIRYIRSNY